MKKEMPSGGKRKGAGRPNKYNEPTELVPTRVPKSKKALFKLKVKAILKQWEKK